MPTPPRTRIPLALKSGQWLSPVSDHSTVHLPCSISNGETATLEGELWAKIERKSAKLPFRAEYHEETFLQLDCTLPQLRGKLPKFDIKKKINIEYPIAFKQDTFKWLDTLATGSMSSVKWAVCYHLQHFSFKLDLMNLGT